MATVGLGGVSILELESQTSIKATVHVDVGEWILEGGILRSDDVLLKYFSLITPLVWISDSCSIISCENKYFLEDSFGTLCKRIIFNLKVVV